MRQSGGGRIANVNAAGAAVTAGAMSGRCGHGRQGRSKMEKRLFDFGVPWEHKISFSQGASIRGGRLVLLSGQASLDDDGNVLGKGGMDLQVRNSLEAVRRALALVGATPADVVKLNVYTTDCRAFHKTQPIREASFPKPYPAQTLVEVTRLAMRNFLVEIEATAVVAD
jgi:2-iminobutanoate/2-iminopropanoate deaminase